MTKIPQKTNKNVLSTLASYENSSIAPRVASWTDDEFLEHFTYLKDNPSSIIRFSNYIDNDVNFIAVSGNELQHFLQIIKNIWGHIFLQLS